MARSYMTAEQVAKAYDEAAVKDGSDLVRLTPVHRYNLYDLVVVKDLGPGMIIGALPDRHIYKVQFRFRVHLVMENNIIGTKAECEANPRLTVTLPMEML